MALFSPYFTTRRLLQAGLVVAGVLAGAVLGIMLTRFGKIAAGAPPADLANYLWNATVFGVLSGVVTPMVTWSTLRNVPLWRTIAEPLGLAFAGGGLAIVIGIAPLVLLLPLTGLVAGVVHLQRRYPESHPRIEAEHDAT